MRRARYAPCRAPCRGRDCAAAARRPVARRTDRRTGRLVVHEVRRVVHRRQPYLLELVAEEDERREPGVPVVKLDERGEEHHDRSDVSPSDGANRHRASAPALVGTRLLAEQLPRGWMLRRAEHRGGGALLDHPALGEDHDAVGEVAREVVVVRRDQQRPALAARAAQRLAQRRRGAPGRATRSARPSAAAADRRRARARSRRVAPRRPRARAEARRRGAPTPSDRAAPAAALAPRGAARRWTCTGASHDVVERRQVLEQVMQLEDHADLAAQRRERRRGAATRRARARTPSTRSCRASNGSSAATRAQDRRLARRPTVPSARTSSPAADVEVDAAQDRRARRGAARRPSTSSTSSLMTSAPSTGARAAARGARAAATSRR